ncbi:curli-like amyloid fiber formation chaperone CsgH [uncultured Pontibacter sp.]|uniref:curli-like amyloid fiber formation chaperone CsgH n=1 Tax=uncultured Pontibacter sp. TaxID=453356 RepID=UPI0026225355|nr:curli-like amyloid fiber formation chaperone CsgH [uncultured Pontibacter sp.]
MKTDERYAACIKTEVIGNNLKLKGVFENNTTEAGAFTYKFKCKRTSRSGSSISSQSGAVRAAAGEAIVLSKVSVSFSSDSAYKLDLTVYNGLQEVAAATVSYPR